jgi:NADPH:quinone reductase-like Zn-dependent oxidoreductase
MKAAVINEYGDESVLTYQDMPDPTVGPDDVLIRVSAASINRGDFGRRAGFFQAGQTPLIIGWDIAGDIVQTGANVTNLAPASASSPGHGRRLRELAAAPANATVLPDAISYEEAASLPVAWLTA